MHRNLYFHRNGCEISERSLTSKTADHQQRSSNSCDCSMRCRHPAWPPNLISGLFWQGWMERELEIELCSTEWSKSGALKAVGVFSLYTTIFTLWTLIGLDVRNASGIYWPFKGNPEWFSLAWVIFSTRVLRILAWDWYSIYQAS